MNETTTICVQVQVEHLSEQMLRARPLGPWKIQAVGQSWSEVRRTLLRQLKKAVSEALPTDLYAGQLPDKFQRTSTLVELPPGERDVKWTKPIQVELECFQWKLNNGNGVVKIPAVQCTLYCKWEEIDEALIAKQARTALMRIAENKDLQSLGQRFARRRFDFRSLRTTLPLGGQPEKKARQVGA